MAADDTRRVLALLVAAPPSLPSGEGKGPTSGYEGPKASAASDVTTPAAEHAGTCSPGGSGAARDRPGSPEEGDGGTVPAGRRGRTPGTPAPSGRELCGHLRLRERRSPSRRCLTPPPPRSSPGRGRGKAPGRPPPCPASRAEAPPLPPQVSPGTARGTGTGTAPGLPPPPRAPFCGGGGAASQADDVAGG